MKVILTRPARIRENVQNFIELARTPVLKGHRIGRSTFSSRAEATASRMARCGNSPMTQQHSPNLDEWPFLDQQASRIPAWTLIIRISARRCPQWPISDIS
jgi:hypothetical protein